MSFWNALSFGCRTLDLSAASITVKRGNLESSANRPWWPLNSTVTFANVGMARIHTGGVLQVGKPYVSSHRVSCFTIVRPSV